MAPWPVVQLGIPDLIPQLVGIAGTVVLVLILVALGGFAYKSLTGGVEWPADREDDDEGIRRGGDDEEWDYY